MWSPNGEFFLFEKCLTVQKMKDAYARTERRMKENDLPIMHSVYTLYKNIKRLWTLGISRDIPE
jgi:hypothetical protein